MVPLMSMLRAGARCRRACSSPPATPTTSSTTTSWDAATTSSTPTPAGRPAVDRLHAACRPRMLREVDVPGARVYVCGPTPFVESVANDLVALGHDPAAIRTERFRMTHFDGNAAPDDVFARVPRRWRSRPARAAATTGPVAPCTSTRRLGTVLRCPGCDAVLMRVARVGETLVGDARRQGPALAKRRLITRSALPSGCARRPRGDGRAGRPRTA